MNVSPRLNRKQGTLARGLLCALLIGTLASGHSLGASQDQPNILWITIEDASSNIGAFGDIKARTLRLDALAAEGVRYTNVYSVAGVCAPSRSGLITGMYPSSLGSQHMRSSARLPDHVKPYPTYLRQQGYYTTNNSKTDYNFEGGQAAWDETSGKAHWRNRPSPDQPFFAVFNFNTSHESRIADDDRYRDAISGLPASLIYGPDDLTPPPYLPDTPEVREDWARYYNIMTAVDRQVGDMLDQLEEDGLAEDTIVFFYTDHGVGLPRAKRWLYDSGMKVPMIIRTPEKFRMPDSGNPGDIDERLISFLDLAPTVIRLAGGEIPDHMQGLPFLGPSNTTKRTYVFAARDRMDERYDIIRAVRDGRYKYIRNYEPYKPYFQYMNTPEKGKSMQAIRSMIDDGTLPAALRNYAGDSKPPEEFYDTFTDPYELHNLAADPRFEADLKRLRAAHEKWSAKTYDTGLIPEVMIRELEGRFEKPIYDVLREDLPELSGRISGWIAGGPPEVDEAVEALRDGEAAVRYWGVIGLDLAGEVSGLEAMLEDGSVLVRLAAGRALCRGGGECPVDVLSAGLGDEEEWVRLFAALCLDEIEELGRPAVASLELAMGDSNKYVVRVANRALNQLMGTRRVVP